MCKIDIAVCNTKNLVYTEKMSKYIHLATKTKGQWQVESVKIIPITISTSGVVPKSLRLNLNLLDMI